MSGTSDSRRKPSRRITSGVIGCPSCGGPLKSDSKWCPTCHFTGAQTVDLFPHDPPPLLPVLDAVAVLDEGDLRKITAAREKVRKRFPQFRWKVCLVDLPAEMSLPVFGFWLLNVCPFQEGETIDDRAWTVLLLINAGTSKAAVIPAYAAEPFLANEDWKMAMAAMVDPWKAGKPAEAIIRFLESSKLQLDRAWSRYGSRRSNKN